MRATIALLGLGLILGPVAAHASDAPDQWILRDVSKVVLDYPNSSHSIVAAACNAAAVEGSGLRIPLEGTSFGVTKIDVRVSDAGAEPLCSFHVKVVGSSGKAIYEDVLKTGVDTQDEQYITSLETHAFAPGQSFLIETSSEGDNNISSEVRVYHLYSGGIKELLRVGNDYISKVDPDGRSLTIGGDFYVPTAGLCCEPQRHVRLIYSSRTSKFLTVGTKDDLAYFSQISIPILSPSAQAAADKAAAIKDAAADAKERAAEAQEKHQELVQHFLNAADAGCGNVIAAAAQDSGVASDASIVVASLYKASLDGQSGNNTDDLADANYINSIGLAVLNALIDQVEAQCALHPDQTWEGAAILALTQND